MTVATSELTCRELVALLADYVAGELGHDERSAFERHLAACPDCLAYLRSYAETMRRAKDAYHADEVPADVPDGLVRAILEARRRFVRSARGRSSRRRLLL